MRSQSSQSTLPAKKHLGQHFLVSSSHAERIARAVPAGPDDRVLEIGPGRGALSVYLKDRFSHFHMVELDQEVIPILESRLGPGSWVVHHANALRFDFSRVGFPLHVVGNLPYVTAAGIIHKTLRLGNGVLSCTFMVQREVAQRIAALPHTRDMGYLSVFCQFFGTPRILFHVPPGAFNPQPNVVSSVFQIVVRSGLEDRLSRDLWDPFFGFVDKAFRMRRKTLPNALSPVIDKSLLAQYLSMECIHAQSRPEELSVEQWLGLFRRIHSAGVISGKV